MNRRGFLQAMLKAGVGAMILPPAFTYARSWKPTATGILTCREFSTYLISTNFMFDDLGRKILEDVKPLDAWTNTLQPGVWGVGPVRRDFVKTFFSPNEWD